MTREETRNALEQKKQDSTEDAALKISKAIEADIEELLDGETFPIGALPLSIQKAINAANTALKFPKDYLSGAMLFAASVAIGNSVKVSVKETWMEHAILYLINIGPPGCNKTHPTKWALDPLLQADAAAYSNYRREKKTYDEVSAMSSKDRKEQNIAEPVKPFWKKTIVSDFTPEALVKCHQFNYRGLGVYADEALAWIGNFNRYNKGSESQFWLSNWSATPINIDRKGEESILIQKPCIGVIGSIQPAMLSELAKDSREVNGFIDRLLFVYPENVKKESWTDDELDPNIYLEWKEVVNKIMNIRCELDGNNTPESLCLKFTPDAWKSLNDWQKLNTDLCNESDERTKSIFSKMEIFALRFSLIIQVLRWACGEDDLSSISLKSVENAVKLTEYFRKTAVHVNAMLVKCQTLPENKKALLSKLPQEFTTGEGSEIAKGMGISERTFKSWLNEPSLFQKLKYGTYKKLADQ